MSNQTPKKIPENLIDFARLANISEESLEQILDNLKQAGIEIKDPKEKLSAQTKARLLAFFRKTKITSKHTHTSTLKGSSGSAKVTITTVSRKETQEEAPDVSNESSVANQTLEKTEDQTPDALSESLKAIQSQEELAKRQKANAAKRKTKLEAASKLLKRSKNKLNAFENKILYAEDEEKEAVPLSEPKPATKKAEPSTKSVKQTFKKPIQSITHVVWIPESITVFELAKKMSIKDREVIKQLEQLGMPVAHSQESLDQDTAMLLVEEMGHQPRLIVNNAKELALRESLENELGDIKKRPPIVTIMGHVDHGKTSLLDYIRREKVASKESGGITQHIGAYHVTLPKGKLTFLDTPGHAAFTAMRARGAHVTDIVALVVAADDGVMPQTQEAIEHAQAAEVPIVVVVNKIDKPGASMDLAQQGLAKYNLISEEWGGDTLFIGVSAKTGHGVDDFLDAVLLQAEMSELSAPSKGPAQGIIIESRLEKGRGAVATMIVQKGMLKKGDVLLAGTSFGKLKALTNENGQSIASATPSIPVEVLGLSNPPLAGEEAIVLPNEKKAREIAELREVEASTSKQKAQTNGLFESFIDPFKAQLQKLIHVIIKADVQGSAEALKESLVKLSTEEVEIKPLMTGVGNITESDVNLAIASKASIFGFNVGIVGAAKRSMQQEKIKLYHSSIIYELLEEAQKMVLGLTEPEVKETILGKALVKKVFEGKKTAIAGCLVTEGSIRINTKVRVIRNNKTIQEGKIFSLKRFKDTVKEAHLGTECGIILKNYTDFQVDDVIENYEQTQY